MTYSPVAIEYQDVLKTAAIAFLKRHQCEHLNRDHQLFERAVRHLVGTHDVLVRTAERIVGSACAELEAISERQRLDVLSSSETHSVIVDPYTGTAWAIPVSLIYERIIKAQDNERFRLTKV